MSGDTRLNRRAAGAAFGLWLLCCVLLLVQGAQPGGYAFADPDDSMRLVQVRDFLGGQGWFDVSQHRVNPPLGGPMHWSRLVDLPIAGLILLFRPIFGMALSERISCLIVPLLLLGGVWFCLFRATRLLAGSVVALVSTALLIGTFGVLVQLGPMRIDHHGWQILMGAITLCGAFDPHVRRGGLMAGAAMALWLHISSEGLPYAALFGGLFAVRFILRAEEWPRLLSCILVLTCGSLLLLFGTHGWTQSFVAYCDAMSPPYYLPLLLIAALLPLARWFLPDSLSGRAGATLLAGGAGAALFLLVAGPCLRGPFASLDPLVYSVWYVHVQEGRPIWEQDLAMAGVLLLPPLIGLFGSGVAAFRSEDRRGREAWQAMLLLQAGALAVAVMVLRGISIAHLFALPGIGWLLYNGYRWIRAHLAPVPATAAMLPLALLTPTGSSSAWVNLAGNGGSVNQELSRSAELCVTAARMKALNSLAPATLFAPLDFGPAILVGTSHRVVGTGHHRNAAGMVAVLRGYLAPPDHARAVIAGTSASYVLYCPALRESRRLALTSPAGLLSQLQRGRIPAWLTPVPLKGLAPLRLYRIEPAEKRMAAPFMQ